ncbi:hypothetical protein BGW42_006892 [Actinomortierella wolfii]|nr:hypothetical protein BGW42_006892 [Actinomortierella wolfii]
MFRGVPFSAGSLGTQRRAGTDEMIISLNDRGSSVDSAGHANGTAAAAVGVAGTGKGQNQRTAQGAHDFLMVLAPQRLPYEIQIASGWDNGFPPEELVGLMETMAGKGWHTPRFCKYPQDLVLRFTCGRSRIKTIQILSHQYKIASKLDFWVGSRKGTETINVEESSAGTACAKYQHHGEENDQEQREESEDGLLHQQRKPTQERQLPVLQFEKLGSISFDSNEYSKFSGRELRSISCDVEGEYLRVVIRRCHVNHLNIYHQAAILALNVLGEPLEDELIADSEKIAFGECEIVNEPSYGQSEHSLPVTPSASDKQKEVSTVTAMVESLSVRESKDHATPTYLDTEIQQLVTGFIHAKNDAAKAERYACAKEYKTGLEGILKFADEIQEISIQKQKAVEEDDFDLAQELKVKIDGIKARLDEHLAKEGFLVQVENETTRVMRMDYQDNCTKEHSAFSASKFRSTGNFAGLMHNRNMSNTSISNIGDGRAYHHHDTPPSSAPDQFTSSTSDSSDQEKRHRGDYSGRIPVPHSRHSLNRSQSDMLSRSFTDRSHHTLTGASPPPSQLPHKMMYERLQRRQQVEPRAPQDETLPFIAQEDYAAFDPLAHSTANDSKVQDDLLLDDLTDKERRDFAVALQIFNDRIISCAISRELHLRLYSIEFVREYLENEMASEDVEHPGDKALLARAVFQIIAAGLTDTREKVVSKVLSLLDQAVRFCLQNEVPASTAYRSLEPIFPILMVKAADLNTRVSQGIMARIVMLCNSFRTQHFSVLPLVFRPSRNTLPYKQAQARVEIVTRLVNEFGVYDRAAGKGTPSGLDFNSITEFVIPYLNHTNGEVRMAAKKLVVDVCRFLNKTRVDHFLPGLKPLIIESIQKELEAKRTPLLPPLPSMSSTSTTRQSQSSRSTTPVMLSKRTVSSPAGSIGNTSGANTSMNKGQSPAKIGVDLHVESLHSLLKAPDTPVASKTSASSTGSTRSSVKPLSVIAQAHVSRVKKPLRTSIKSTHNLPRLTSKRETAVSPDEESTTESEKPPLPLPPPMAPRTAVRPLYARSKNLQVKTGASTTTANSTVTAADGKSSSVGRAKASSSSSSSSSTSPPETAASSTTTSPSRTTKDRFCVFCDEYNSAFTDDGLVAHYWNDCPMLANCPFCKIIIEVSTLSEHMLTECTRRKFIKQCEKCHEIIAAEDYLAHTARNACIPIPDGAEHCPLCQFVMQSTDEEAWREHLMAEEGGCPKNRNPRRRESGASTMVRLNAGSGHSSSDETKIKRSSAIPGVTPHGRGMSSTTTTSKFTEQRSLRQTPTRTNSATTSRDRSVTRSTPTRTSTGGSIGHSSMMAHHHLEEPVHPFDPAPLPPLPSPPASDSMASPPMQTEATHNGQGATSRIPKFGAANRSISSNSLSNQAWR